MGSWVYTYVRTDKITDEQAKQCINRALEYSNDCTYERYSALPEEKYVKLWIAFNKANKDYLINTCHVPAEHLTDEYLTQDIKNRIKTYNYIKTCYNKVLNKEMSFEEMIENIYDANNDDLSLHRIDTIKYNGHYYAKLGQEIFRVRGVCDPITCTTVKEIIDYLKTYTTNSICDYAVTDENNCLKYDILTEQLQKRIEEYYGKIGDENFIVDII